MKNKFGKSKKAKGKSPSTHKHKNYVSPIIDKVIENSDIILEVLDSRFIEKTRNPKIEKKVKDVNKILIYVFNKSDLVDINKIKLKTELEKLKPNVFFSSKEKKGYLNLKKLIKIQSKRLKKEPINIGIVGYPNTGKSSLINFISKRSAVKTSSEAGYTKGIQKIKLSKGLYLIDTPGIIPSLEKSSTKIKDLVKQPQIGAVTWDKTKNPDLVIHKLMKEYPNVLEKYYKIDAKADSEFLIESLGKKLNYIKKGNLIDDVRTAKKILKDWQEGKIKII
jgi:ribosome biogenesis GTPase A|tara:strand:- start:179 stop:1012 length:834 start_codon:yes stop_codon:yes gene_type:complete